MPDITIYFNNLHYGTNWEIGHENIYSTETETGTDDCNHSELGLVGYYGEDVDVSVVVREAGDVYWLLLEMLDG